MNCPQCQSRLTIDQTEFFESHICEVCENFAELIDITKCCLAPSFTLKKLIISNGAIQVRNQCKNCGYVDRSSIGGLTAQQRQALPEVDTVARIERDKKRNQLRKEFWDNRRELTQQKFEKGKQDYHAIYLNSPEWKIKRKLVLERDNYICQSCRVVSATDVHHLTYDHLGNEPLFELVAVCRPCHEAIEAMKTGKMDGKIFHKILKNCE